MWDWLTKLDELRKEYIPTAIVTITHCTGSTPRGVGAKMLVLVDGRFWGTVGGGSLEYQAIEKAREILATGTSQSIEIPLDEKAGQKCGGTVQLLIEVVNTAPQLFIFGAGHVGQAVCQVLSGTPFRIHLVDEREEWIRQQSIPSEVVCHHCHWKSFVSEAGWDSKRTFAVVMTHKHQFDEEIVEAILKKDQCYVGMIASRNKWAQFRVSLKQKGMSEEDLQTIRSPIGLDIGGKSPKEIAISVAAEVLSVYYGKEACSLSSYSSGRG